MSELLVQLISAMLSGVAESLIVKICDAILILHNALHTNPMLRDAKCQAAIFTYRITYDAQDVGHKKIHRDMHLAYVNHARI